MSNNGIIGAWLLLFSTVYLRFIHVSVSIICSLLLLNSISLYGYTICLYLCTSWRILGLFSAFDNYKLCWYRHLHIGLCAEIYFYSSVRTPYLGVGYLPHVINVCLTILNCLFVFQSSCTIFSFPPACMRVHSSCSVSSTFDMVNLFIFILAIIIGM